MTSSNQSHAENSGSRLQKDEQAVQDIDNCITEFKCDPFDVAQPQLRSLESGLNASEELVRDFKTAHKDGEKCVQDFFKDGMFTTDKPFRAAVHQPNRRSFSKPPLPNDTKETKSLKTDTMENKSMIAVHFS